MVTLYWGELAMLAFLPCVCWNSKRVFSCESMLGKQEEGLLLIGTGNTAVSVTRKVPRRRICFMSMEYLYTILE